MLTLKSPNILYPTWKLRRNTNPTSECWWYSFDLKSPWSFETSMSDRSHNGTFSHPLMKLRDTQYTPWYHVPRSVRCVGQVLYSIKRIPDRHCSYSNMFCIPKLLIIVTRRGLIRRKTSKDSAWYVMIDVIKTIEVDNWHSSFKYGNKYNNFDDGHVLFCCSVILQLLFNEQLSFPTISDRN